jgi:TatD DNase family protein
VIELFDTHCHMHELLQKLTPVYDKWREDGVERTPDQVIADAHAAGVNRILCVGTTLADSELAVSFVQGRENIWATIGIHPHEAADHCNEAAKKQFANLLEDGPIARNARRSLLRAHDEDIQSIDRKIVAIGECGLDYFYTHSPKEAQVEILKFQIELALEHDLPLSFHVREAFDDFWPIFESYRGANIRGVLHSYTDNLVNLERAVKHGLYFGVNGIATFAKSEAQLVTYRTIPQQLLLLETDAPFLTPVPFRGKVCESKHVAVTASYLADLRGEPLEQLAQATTANARALFTV